MRVKLLLLSIILLMATLTCRGNALVVFISGLSLLIPDGMANYVRFGPRN